MTTKKKGYQEYTQAHAIEFVRLLGLWSFANPWEASKDPKKRSTAEYHIILQQLIRANRSRKDYIGEMETAAAKRELALLGGK